MVPPLSGVPSIGTVEGHLPRATHECQTPASRRTRSSHGGRHTERGVAQPTHAGAGLDTDTGKRRGP